MTHKNDENKQQKQQHPTFPLTFDVGVSMTLRQWYNEYKARYGDNAEVEEDGMICPEGANLILSSVRGVLLVV